MPIRQPYASNSARAWFRRMYCAKCGTVKSTKPRLLIGTSDPNEEPGFRQGSAVGEILRDLVLRRPTFVDIAPLGVERFDAAALRTEYNVV